MPQPTPPRLRPWRPERDAASVLAAFDASADRDPRHGTAWLSYWLAPAARGRGLASRALDTLSRRLFADGLHRLELGARANNPASIAVAQRAGYVREGVERERLRYVDGHGRAERFDVVRLARLASDAPPGLEPL